MSDKPEAAEKVVMCKCRRNPATPGPHTCPFEEDIHGDSTPCCTCCDDCVYQCQMDI